jgi:hypothetical protein
MIYVVNGAQCICHLWTPIGLIAALLVAVAVWNVGGFSTGREPSPAGDVLQASSTVAPNRHAKTSLPAEADHPPVQPSEPAEAETWSEADVVAALEECARLLAPTGDNIEISKPIRNGQCGTPAPVILKRVAGIELTPPAVVNCRLAAKLRHWIEEAVQPTAQEVLGEPIKAIVNASAYVCRQRTGNASERLSEHSFANALDISAFVTGDGRSIALLMHWGQTVRDLQAQAKNSKLAGGDARPLADPKPVYSSKEAQFLRRMHETACRMFGTVLGPEANEAHRDHLHLDLATRRRSSFCQ